MGVKPEVVVGDIDELAETLASEVAAEGESALRDRGQFTIALPGGSVAERMFPRLSHLPLDWSRTHFFWVDERAVPPSHPDSNYRLALSTWLGPAAVPPASVHRMPGEADDLDRAARDYGEELASLAGNPPRLDVVLLGVGPDGHVASLFTGHPALAREREIACAIVDSPKPPPRRLTLTVPVLAGARRLIVVAPGLAKAAVMQQAIENQKSNLPIAIVTRRASRPLVLLDREAASLVRDSGSARSGT